MSLENPKQEQKQFVSDIFLRFGAQVVLNSRSIAFLPLIAKSLGEIQYGIWTQFVVTLTLLAPVLSLRLESAVIRYMSSPGNGVSKSDFLSLLILICFLILIFSSVGYAFKNELSEILFGSSEYVFITLLFLIFVFFRTSFLFLLNYYRALRKVKRYTAIELGTATIQVLIAAYLITTTDVGIAGLLIAFIAIEGISALLIFLEILISERFSFRFNLKSIRPYVEYSLPLVPSRGLNWIIEYGDRYIITHFVGLAAVGIYNASYILSHVSTFMLLPMMFVLFPTISSNWKDEKFEVVRSYLENSLKYYLLLAIPGSFGILFLSPFLLALLADEGYLSSSLLIPLLLLGLIFSGVTQIYMYLFHLAEKTKTVFVQFLFAATISIALNILLVPKIGILGAGIAMCVAYFVRMVIVVISSARLFRISIDVVNVFKILLGSVIMFAVMSLIGPSTTFQFVTVAMLGALIYVMIMILLRVIGEQEVAFVRALVVRS